MNSGIGPRRALLASAALFAAGPLLPFAVVLVDLVSPQRMIRTPRTDLPRRPSIDVVIPAYLESSVIGHTIRRLRSDLDATDLRYRIHVVASDDETANASALADTVTSTGRGGKPAAINLAVERSEADIVVLTDANCVITPPAWPEMMLKELAETDLLSANKMETGSRDSLFWLFESYAKKAARRSTGSLGVIGEFLAFRRPDYENIPPDAISDDLWLAIQFDSHGRRVAISSCIQTVEPATPPAEQWKRRVRIAEGQLSEALPRVGSLLRTAPGRHYLAHKMYRLTIGAAGFWIAVLSLIRTRPAVGLLLAVPSVSLSVAQYKGALRLHTPLDPLTAIIGLQAVPVAALFRIVRRWLSGVERGPGWEKVAR